MNTPPTTHTNENIKACKQTDTFNSKSNSPENSKSFLQKLEENNTPVGVPQWYSEPRMKL